GYIAGDFHNHTTGSDGSTSIQRLTYESVDTYGLDWFAQSGHGGSFSRDLRLDDFNYNCDADGQGNSWENTVGIDNFRGDPTGTGYCGAQDMWRWQSLQEFAYPKMIEKANQYDKPIWLAFEYQVPGHEHCSMGTIAGQFDKNGGNADALAEFEYRFDMEDNDFSAGDGQGWRGKIPNPPKDGLNAGAAGHEKAVKSVKWLQKNHPLTSYLVWAHIERKGAWDQDKGGNNTGYNVEHFRDFNNAGPDVAFGFEGQPGHQASGSRGGFGSGAFGGTRGGTGKYCAEVGGLWDALLGEGRNWWNFASSDWHNRGSFTPYDQKTTNDFWPGEFQKNYVWVNKANPKPQDIIDGMRSGNSFTVMGDLIDDLEFTISRNANGKGATMGETLTVKAGKPVVVTVRVHDPESKNHCPYSFGNPSLAQIGISQPLNMPQLDNIQLICGDVTGKIKPRKAAYTYPNNDNMRDVVVVSRDEMMDEGDGWYSFEYTTVAENDFYCRLRGTNLPQGTPYETYPLDTDAPEGPGGPRLDAEAGNIQCLDEGCPEHVGGVLTNDVEAWSDIWFYSNPVFVDVE
ncbi:MAG: hypothetical protein V2I40_07195, partial [Desulfobacteraceae bacterium]|nr:hypothetical protein [Desulfobacteraceae bacterium]